jgi:hypothetical protein
MYDDHAGEPYWMCGWRFGSGPLDTDAPARTVSIRGTA